MYIVGYDMRTMHDKTYFGTEPDPNRVNRMREKNRSFKLGGEDVWLVWCDKCGTNNCACKSLPMTLPTLSLNGAFPGGDAPLYGKEAVRRWGAVAPGMPTDFLTWARMFYSLMACDA